MRVFVLMLLVLNLTFFGWQYLGDPERAEEEVMQSMSADAALAAPSLVLVKEAVLPASRPKSIELNDHAPVIEVESQAEAVMAEAPIEEIEAAVAIRPEPLARCYKVGAFVARQQPSSMIEVAERYGFETAIRARQVERLFGEWVYLTGYHALAAARADVVALKQQGVRDISIARLDDGQLIISLGIFGQQKTLQARLREVEALGYVNHQQRQRFRKVEELWLVLSGFEGEQQQAMAVELNAALSAHFPSVEMQTVDCG